MKKTTFLSVSMLLSACLSTQQFVPRQLNNEARGISTVKTTPYGCKVLGEIEGKDSSPVQPAMVIVVGNTLSALREGAMNDLRNNAVEVVGNHQKQTVLKITRERAICNGHQACPPSIQENHRIESYLVVAEVFECSDK